MHSEWYWWAQGKVANRVPLLYSSRQITHLQMERYRTSYYHLQLQYCKVLWVYPILLLELILEMRNTTDKHSNPTVYIARASLKETLFLWQEFFQIRNGPSPKTMNVPNSSIDKMQKEGQSMILIDKRKNSCIRQLILVLFLFSREQPCFVFESGQSWDKIFWQSSALVTNSFP